MKRERERRHSPPLAKKRERRHSPSSQEERERGGTPPLAKKRESAEIGEREGRHPLPSLEWEGRGRKRKREEALSSLSPLEREREEAPSLPSREGGREGEEATSLLPFSPLFAPSPSLPSLHLQLQWIGFPPPLPLFPSPFSTLRTSCHASTSRMKTSLQLQLS